MKLPRAFIFAGFALLLTLDSCASRSGQVKGEVFIVTKGGENIKLGLVEVKVIGESEINAAIEKRNAAIASKLAELRSDCDKAMAEYNSIHQAYQHAKDNYDKSSQRIRRHYE
jgi:predicted component of type VI protein secretion system